MIPADTEKVPEPGNQGGAAVEKREKVHVLMGAGIVPVDEARLRRRGNLVEQGAHSAGRRLVSGEAAEIVV